MSLPPQDIPTGADSCVTSLSCASRRSLIAAGLGDGSVRVYDRRMGPNEWYASAAFPSHDPARSGHMTRRGAVT